ncbi:MAG TPA: tetratricopeptide repeat protein [Vicinamibacterales bacterium]|nr:tetratricopeptide repeat protein [Vicinamibacterales bacterium]
MRRPLPSAACTALTVVVVLVAGCAARPAPNLASRLVRGADGPGGLVWPMAAEPGETGETAPAPPEGGPGAAATSEPVPGVRARHEIRDADTLETFDPRLQAALSAIEGADTRPTVEALLDAADEYWRLGVFDRAHRLLTQALGRAPRDARTLEALARLWRDWGVPAQGLADAYRAASAAPASPAVQNTLATVLFHMGHVEAAEARFAEVLRLDPRAAYAQSNLCYAALARGDEDRALAACRAALEVDPANRAARNNLALVHAAADRWDDAAREFLTAAGDEATARYNLGMALLSRREYTRAAEAFDAAARLQPDPGRAHERAREARRLAGGAGITQPLEGRQ